LIINYTGITIVNDCLHSFVIYRYFFIAY